MMLALSVQHLRELVSNNAQVIDAKRRVVDRLLLAYLDRDRMSSIDLSFGLAHDLGLRGLMVSHIVGHRLPDNGLLDLLMLPPQFLHKHSAGFGAFEHVILGHLFAPGSFGHHAVTVDQASAAELRSTKSTLKRSLTPIVRICQSDRVGEAGTGAAPVPPMIGNGAASSMCNAVSVDVSISGAGSTAEASPIAAMAIRSLGATAGEPKIGNGGSRWLQVHGQGARWSGDVHDGAADHRDRAADRWVSSIIAVCASLLLDAAARQCLAQATRAHLICGGCIKQAAVERKAGRTGERVGH
jgi:hypothetical protein